MMEEVHAHSGAVYLLTPGEAVLEMAVMAGMPRSFAAPWERVGLNAPIPVAVAVRERRLVCLGRWRGGDGSPLPADRRGPAVPLALAALPVATAGTVYGAVFVTWPGSHPQDLSDRERDHLTASCARLALRLERAAAERRPVHPEPDLLAPSAAPATGALGTLEAARMVARLPYGLCALDLNGRVSFANAATADMLGVPVSELLGTQLWASVPWLDDPVYEDRYRAALISQHVTSFVALRPPGDWLSFRLYPSTTGLSVRISRARAVAEMGRVESRHVEQHHPAPGDHRPGAQPGRRAHPGGGGRGRGAAGGGRDRAGRRRPRPWWSSAQSGRLHVLGHRGYADAHIVERWRRGPTERATPGTQALKTGVPTFLRLPSAAGAPLLPGPERDARRDGGVGVSAADRVRTAGGTCVLGYAEPHIFPAEERAVLTSLCGLIAQALERALLYDAKLQLAHGLQAALLPHSLPALPSIEAAARYLPATQGMEISGTSTTWCPRTVWPPRSSVTCRGTT